MGKAKDIIMMWWVAISRLDTIQAAILKIN